MRTRQRSLSACLPWAALGTPGGAVCLRLSALRGELGCCPLSATCAQHRQRPGSPRPTAAHGQHEAGEAVPFPAARQRCFGCCLSAWCSLFLRRAVLSAESLQLSRPFRESSAGASGVSSVALARGADGWGVLRRIQRHGEGPWLCSGLRHSCSGTSGDTQVPCEPPRGPLHGEAHDGCPGCCSCNLLGATAVSERVCQSREVRFAV